MGKGIIALIIAVVCLIYIVAPDPFPIVVDDIGALGGMVISIVKAIEAFKSSMDKAIGSFRKKDGSDGTEGDYNDVTHN